MKRNYGLRMWAVGLGVLTALALGVAPIRAQGWKMPSGSARAAWVNSGGAATSVAETTLPQDGGFATADQQAVSVSGLLSTSSATSVTSGLSTVDRLGVQGVATASDVNVLGGRILASQVIAVATVSDLGNKTIADGDGSGASGLIVDGVSFGDFIAPNTRVELPGAGYVVLNEQVKGKGRGTSVTVNMIHVYLTGATTGEIVVASASSGSSS